MIDRKKICPGPNIMCWKCFLTLRGNCIWGTCAYIPSAMCSPVFFKNERLQCLHPMGWDAFGLPAENAAITNKVNPPAEWVAHNIRQMKEQQDNLGISYDWDREITTSLPPDYYRWTQWLFLLFYKRGLAYRKKRHPSTGVRNVLPCLPTSRLKGDCVGVVLMRWSS